MRWGNVPGPVSVTLCISNPYPGISEEFCTGEERAQAEDPVEGIIVLISREANLLPVMESVDAAETEETEDGEAREVEAEIGQDAEGEADPPEAEVEKEGLEDISKDTKTKYDIKDRNPKNVTPKCHTLCI